MCSDMQALLQLPGMQDLVEALASYTQRHFVRIDRLVRSSFLLDYTLASMNVIMPEADGMDAQSIPMIDDTDASLQQAEVQIETVRAADDIQAVLANQTLPAQLQQEQVEQQQEMQEGAMQQGTDGVGPVVSNNQVDAQQGHKVKPAKTKRKSSNTSTEPHTKSGTVKANRKKVQMAA